MAFLYFFRLWLKRALLGLCGLVALLPSLVFLTPFISHASAAGDGYTLSGASKKANDYIGGTIYIKSDALKTYFGTKYTSQGLALPYVSPNYSGVGDSTGDSIWVADKIPSPKSTSAGDPTGTPIYWCKAKGATDGLSSSGPGGTIDIAVYQSVNGGWVVTAFCNEDINNIVLADPEPDNIPWGKATGNRANVSVTVAGVTPTPAPPATLPDVSKNETYKFTTESGDTIHACAGVFAQFPGGCLDFTYDKASSTTFDTGNGDPIEFYTASGLANNVCSVTMGLQINLSSAKDGPGPTGGSITGQNILPHPLSSPKDRNGVFTGCSSGEYNFKFFPTDSIKYAAFKQSISVTGTLSNFLGLKTGTGTCADGSDPDSNGVCATQLDCGSGVLNWIVCAVIDAAKSAAGVVDNMIMSSLNTDVTTIFDTKNSGCTASSPCVQNGYYTAWNSFRIFATVLIVIAGLVMVSSQALGFEILDAYTVRKVLPRLLIAIIGISLSWPLMRFVVQFFDTLGFDIRNIIYGPFQHLGGKISLTTGIFTWLGAGAAIFLLGPATLSFLVTAFFALLIGFLIIIFRQVAIVVLIILAPLAIAFYILPNTQKLWKMWYDNFLGLMLVFPIISAFIAAGHVFSAVTLASASAQSGVGGVINGTMQQAIGLLAYFIPYFVLPLAFRLATGVIGSIAGFANDRGRGIFDRQKKKRQAAMADRIGRARGENLYSNDTRRGRLANKAASWATAPGASIAYAGRNKIPGLKRAGSRIESQIEHARVEQSGKAFETLNKMGYNDKAYRALSGVHRGLDYKTQQELAGAGLLNKAPATMKEVQQMGQILSRSENGTERIGGNALMGSAGYLGNLYKDPEMGKASLQAAGIMGLAAHGFAGGEDLAGAGNMLMGGSFVSNGKRDAKGNMLGTYEGPRDEKGNLKLDHHQAAFSQAIVSQAQMLGARSRPDTKPGYGVVYDKDTGQWLDGMTDGNRAKDVIKTLSSHDLAGAKGDAIGKLEGTIIDTINGTNGSNAGESQAVKDQLFSWAGPYSQASTDVKARAIAIIDKMSGGKKDQIRVVKAADGTERTVRTNGYDENTIGAEFDRYRRAEADPSTRGEGGPETPPDPPPGGGGSGR